MNRLNKDLEGLYKYLRVHFQKRYGIDKDIYLVSISRQLDYLEKIIKLSPDSYKEKLRRR